MIVIAVLGKFFKYGSERIGATNINECKHEKGGSMKFKNKPLGVAVVTFCLALLFGLTANASAAGIKAALIAGVSNYKLANDLNYSAKDAVDFSNKVKWYSTVPAGNIRVLSNATATKATIRATIKTLSTLVKSGDVFLFFFSGHGAQGPDVAPFGDLNDNDEYIAPYETSFLSGGINYASMIRDDELYSWLLPLVTKGAKVLVILDTCYSGGALKAADLSTDKKGRTIKSINGAAPLKGSSSGGFVKDLNVPGFIVMTASDDTELSAENRWFQNGVFTHLLLRALEGGADDSYVLGSIGNDDEVITARELFHNATVVENVPYETSSTTITEYFEQTPQIYGEDDTPLFYLKPIH
jgi:uncharacterized caspase-like protein